MWKMEFVMDCKIMWWCMLLTNSTLTIVLKIYYDKSSECDNNSDSDTDNCENYRNQKYCDETSVNKHTKQIKK